MKLKLVVATMSILGFVSCPLFAATMTTDNASNDSSTDPKPMHHHHHHHHHYHMMRVEHESAATERREEMAEHHDYKYMGSMPCACRVSEADIVLNSMDQNMGRSMPNPCNPGWFNRIQISGGLNVDLGKMGNRNMEYMGENYQRVSANDAYLNIKANVNDWTNVFMSISYHDATTNDSNEAVLFSGEEEEGHLATEYSSAYSNNVAKFGDDFPYARNPLQMEQGFVTFANFNESPIFIQLGKQFVNFGRYELHPITRSLTQVMSETLATAAEIGFISDGFNGSLSVFDDPIYKTGNSSSSPHNHKSTTTNYALSIGYDHPNNCFGWDVGVGYLYNLIGVNDVAYIVEQINRFNTSDSAGVYNSRVGAASLYADLNSGPFTLSARYVAALQRFNIDDLPKDSISDDSSTSGGKPWAAVIQGGYSFEAWCHNQNLYLGYQVSREAATLQIPKSRALIGWNVDVIKNTNFGVEWDHDHGYSQSSGGSGNNGNLVTARATVVFG